MSYVFGKRDPAIGHGGSSIAVNEDKEAPVYPDVNSLNDELLIKLEFDNRPYISVEVLGLKLLGMLDSGAQVTVLGKDSLKVLKLINLDIIPSSKKVKIQTADGSQHNVCGLAYIPFTFNNKTEIVQTYIVPSLSKQLFCGMDFWSTFDIEITIGVDSIGTVEIDENDEVKIQDFDKIHNLTEQQTKQLNDCIKLFKEAAPGTIGHTNVMSYTIDTGNSPPIRSKSHPWSPYIEKEINQEVDRMISLGVIERSTSSWGHPIVPVRKTTGKMRICLDSRKLNAVTAHDPYPLPHLHRILGRLEKSTYLSTVDLSDAFWQIPLDLKSREKTAFIVPSRGLYQFTRLPFGLKNSPMALARCMDRVLDQSWEPNVFVYLDDIVICSETFDEHLEWIRKVANRLAEANLTINTTKSKFCQREIKYLGYILCADGLRPDPAKVSGILNYKAPTRIREVRQFMGMANFYNRFIENYSGIIAPISDLLKGEKKKQKSLTKFIWTPAAENAFNQIKGKLISAPILANPDFNLPFTVQTDSSDRAIGAVLTQVQNGEERVISFYSQKLSSAQRKYAATERECLAVLMSIRHFRCYIEGVHFHVQTDCSAITWIQNLKADGSNRLSRWAMELQQYEMSISHKKGKLNIVPDALSRSLDAIAIGSSTWYQNLRQKIDTNPEKFPLFKIVDDCIYKYISLRSEFGSYVYAWKLVVPPEQRAKILSAEHDEAAHQGFLKTFERIRLRYYWPRMAQEIRRYVAGCEVCKSAKPMTTCSTPPLGRPKLADVPWQLISVDYLGPLPRSKKGNTFLLVVVDWFSKFVILQPFRAAESKSLSIFMENEIFMKKGVPETIISDNGKQFVSKVFKDLLTKYEVNHWLNPSYHPQVNPAERVNKVIVSALKSYVGTDQTIWDQELPRIANAICTSVHDSSGFTPFFINHGREMTLSGKEHQTLRRLGHVDPVQVEQNRIQHFGKLNDTVKTNLHKAYETYSRRYNLRTRPQVNYDVGNTVWRKNRQQSKKIDKFTSKLAPRYLKGTVSAVKGPNTYEINDQRGKRAGIFHACDLKK
jgi:transposase InsO family protein